MKQIVPLVKKHGIKMVEDCAQSVGATFEDKKVGSFGDAGCFSFYATKNITTGEGGMLVTSSEEVKDRALLIRNHGQSKTPKEKFAHWRYDVTDLGFNFRMSEIEAVIGLKQMEKLDLIIESRREIAKRYKEELEKIDGIEMLHDPESDNYRQGVFHLLEVKVEKQYPLKRDKLYDFLKKEGHNNRSSLSSSTHVFLLQKDYKISEKEIFRKQKHCIQRFFLFQCFLL